MLTYRLFRFFSRLLKTVYGFFPTTDVNLSACSDATFENSLRTLPNNGCCSIAYSTSRLLKTVYGFFPTTDANLPTCSDVTFENSLRILPNSGCQSIAYSSPSPEMVQTMDTFLIFIPDGIFKPIHDEIRSPFQMASLSPSPNGIFNPIPTSMS